MTQLQKSAIEAGKKLAIVRERALSAVAVGVSFEELEKIAQEEIKNQGAVPSFPTVGDYKWATCITKNEGCCHGIPRELVVEDGDIITIDVGLIWEGVHSDTASTVCAGSCSQKVQDFLETGKRSLANAIRTAKVGRSVYDIGLAMQEAIESRGCSAVYQLTGHGIGHKLHLEPNIPCFGDDRYKKIKIREGQLLAIEVMYAQGDPTLVLAEDGWTYQSADRSLTGMFEHTVLVGQYNTQILTISPLEKNGVV
ncbi:MAG: Methionine aminopeptidase [Microgenomates group bacterium GW2011_GWF2_45_18]|nr:MAG: Methionine aminopeptidase [Microgenomates group bacterium GW2011_GWF1_44_10]KKU01988.1 MAG: Methionine aminopeptidase [Microgenomates group bacterium GW2011_GWF2_45_18]HAU99027.1 type I methionyl aminopeptidase [Candidatus Paceibacterota bacterium]HAX01258.1 type I methionyl aminopeptidase [Candidatus Paceibacterota bacterium]